MTLQLNLLIQKLSKTYSLYGVYSLRNCLIKLPQENVEMMLIDCEGTNSFQLKFLRILYQDITKDSFNVTVCSVKMGVHRSTLFKNIKGLYGIPLNILIQRCRLEIAKRLLPTFEGNVSHLATAVGFESPCYFTRCFKQYFKKNPSELLRSC